MNIHLNVFGQSPSGHRRKRVLYTAVTGLSGTIHVGGNLAGGIEEVGRLGAMKATICRGPMRPKGEIVCGNAFRAIRQIVEHHRPV